MERIQENLDKMDARMDKREADRAELMAKLKASHAKYISKMKAIDARRLEMEANRRERMANLEATLRSGHEEMIKAITGASQESTEACEEKTKALPETTEACPEVTPACLKEEKKPAAEETEAVAESREVPKGGTDKEMSAGTEDRTGEQRLVVRRHRQWKKRAQVNGGPRQKFSAACGRFTRRAVPAMHKGHVHRGPGKRCYRSGIGGRSKASRAGKRGLAKNNVERGTPGGRTCEKRRRTRPECNSGIRRVSKTSSNRRGGRTEKLDQRLEGIRMHRELIGQSLDLQIAKLVVKSYIRLREPGNGTLWKCRPPPKRKR
jgi:hypothetical protein